MSKFNLLAATGEYKDSQGETKTRFARVGSLWDEGQKLRIKIDSIPVSGWNGWLTVVPDEESRQYQQKPKHQQYQGLPADDDGIPF